MDRFIFKTADIGEKGLRIDRRETAEAFPVLREMVKTSECGFLQPLHISLKVRRVGDIIEAEGRFETRVRMTCSRCLDGFESALSDRLAVTYVREATGSRNGNDNDDVELLREEMSISYFAGETIDLRPAIGDHVLMAFPIRAICKPSCKGLCPQCGADLNRKRCDCAAPLSNSRFAALKGFKAPKRGTRFWRLFSRSKRMCFG